MLVPMSLSLLPSMFECNQPGAAPPSVDGQSIQQACCRLKLPHFGALTPRSGWPYRKGERESLVAEEDEDSHRTENSSIEHPTFTR